MKKPKYIPVPPPCKKCGGAIANTKVYGDDMVLVDRQVCLNCSKEVM